MHASSQQRSANRGNKHKSINLSKKAKLTTNSGSKNGSKIDSKIDSQHLQTTSPLPELNSLSSIFTSSKRFISIKTSKKVNKVDKKVDKKMERTEKNEKLTKTSSKGSKTTLIVPKPSTTKTLIQTTISPIQIPQKKIEQKLNKNIINKIQKNKKIEYFPLEDAIPSNFSDIKPPSKRNIISRKATGLDNNNLGAGPVDIFEEKIASQKKDSKKDSKKEVSKNLTTRKYTKKTPPIELSPTPSEEDNIAILLQDNDNDEEYNTDIYISEDFEEFYDDDNNNEARWGSIFENDHGDEVFDGKNDDLGGVEKIGKKNKIPQISKTPKQNTQEENPKNVVSALTEFVPARRVGRPRKVISVTTANIEPPINTVGNDAKKKTTKSLKNDPNSLKISPSKAFLSKPLKTSTISNSDIDTTPLTRNTPNTLKETTIIPAVQIETIKNDPHRPSSWGSPTIDYENNPLAKQYPNYNKNDPLFCIFFEKIAKIQSYHEWESAEAFRRQVRNLFVMQLRSTLLDPTELAKRSHEIDPEEIELYVEKFIKNNILKRVEKNVDNFDVEKNNFINLEKVQNKVSKMTNKITKTAFTSTTTSTSPSLTTGIDLNTDSKQNTENNHQTVAEAQPAEISTQNQKQNPHFHKRYHKQKGFSRLNLPTAGPNSSSPLPERLRHLMPPISTKDPTEAQNYFKKQMLLLRKNYKSIHQIKFKEEVFLAALEDLNLLPEGQSFQAVLNTPLVLNGVPDSNHSGNEMGKNGIENKITKNTTRTQKNTKKNLPDDSHPIQFDPLKEYYHPPPDSEISIAMPSPPQDQIDILLHTLTECGFFNQEPHIFDIPLRDYSNLRTPYSIASWELVAVPTLQYQRTPELDNSISPQIRLFDQYLAHLGVDQLATLQRLLLQDYRIDLVRQFDHAIVGHQLVRYFLRSESHINVRFLPQLKKLISNSHVHNQIDLKYNHQHHLDQTFIDRMQAIQFTRPKVLADYQTQLYTTGEYNLIGGGDGGGGSDDIELDGEFKGNKLEKKTGNLKRTKNEKGNGDEMNTQNELPPGVGLPTDPLSIYNKNDLVPLSKADFVQHLIKCEKHRYQKQILRSFSYFYQNLLSTQVIHDNFPPGSAHTGFTWVLKHLLDYNIISREINGNLNYQQKTPKSVQNDQPNPTTRSKSLKSDNANQTNTQPFRDNIPMRKSSQKLGVEYTSLPITIPATDNSPSIVKYQSHTDPNSPDFNPANAFPIPLTFDLENSNQTKEALIVEGLQRMKLVGINSGRYADDVFTPVTMTPLGDIHNITPEQIKMSKKLSNPNYNNNNNNNNNNNTQNNEKIGEKNEEKNINTMTFTEALLYKPATPLSRIKQHPSELVSPVERVFSAMIQSGIFAIEPPTVKKF
jgi:hypothetical protein